MSMRTSSGIGWSRAVFVAAVGCLLACSSSSSGGNNTSDGGGSGSGSGSSSGSSSSGGSSSGGTPSQTGNVCCIQQTQTPTQDGAGQTCTVNRIVLSGDEATLTTACTEGPPHGPAGTVAGSCPTANLVGCCDPLPMNGGELCYYEGDAAFYQNICPGAFKTTQ